MEARILEIEPLIRMLFFFSVFVAMTLWEIWAPRRKTPFRGCCAGPTILEWWRQYRAGARSPADDGGRRCPLHAGEKGWDLFNAYQASGWVLSSPPTTARYAVACVMARHMASTGWRLGPSLSGP